MYHIVLREGYAELVDLSDGQSWRFAGGYDPDKRLVSQQECEQVAAWLGERRQYEGSFLEAVDESKGKP